MASILCFSTISVGYHHGWLHLADGLNPRAGRYEIVGLTSELRARDARRRTQFTKRIELMVVRTWSNVNSTPFVKDTNLPKSPWLTSLLLGVVLVNSRQS